MVTGIDEIIIHCSATKEGVDIKASTIDKWHRQNGWRCIGYNYFTNLYGAYRMKVSVTITAGGGSATYTYTTQIGTLTVRLNQFLRSLPHGTAVNISWQTDVFDGTNTYTDTGNFKTTWLFGKTLQERHHGSETIVTWCDSGDLHHQYSGGPQTNSSSQRGKQETRRERI